MQENYLAKWLSGELSEEELREFKNSQEFASYQKLKDVSGNLKAPDFDTEKALQRLKEEHIDNAPKVISLNPFKKFLRVAAVIAILLAGSYFYVNTLNEKVTTDYAERSEVLLPDNSEIFLNADSQVSFNKKNWDNKRNVDLKGEAFFKVAKGKKFTVSTKHGTVAVLGTQFNVENRKGFFEVTCYEGLVSITYNNKETKLPAGTSFLMINGKIVNIGTPNGTLPSWMNNESNFESIPLKYVFAELERQFNVKVSSKNIDTNLLFTGSFNNTNLNMALKSISTPSKTRYKIEGDNVLFYAGNTQQ
ncbi:anti-FecI sigma factor, FecR [Allomuricauda ruestringensis DSM 13258]|uniref:Anti-FecI sigma factor, FecR n=1 Tax=Allomuricauda ruestringensis (strain DSM 13258 / CIP 107369 / LMG 19739 / B1) TaxID=886377 RepID=G2PSL5_ALLRU|nr:FecR family protein [Allomuricauda ruestringensis]AEM69688.1 anti-FecI sigma factor, FecR [Allomuricauda ruestringensis DSM 13258]